MKRIYCFLLAAATGLGSFCVTANDLSFNVKTGTRSVAEVENVRGRHLQSSCSAPERKAPQPELMGCVFGSSAGNKAGLYRISLTEPSMTLLTDKPQATGGGTAGKGQYFCQWYLSMLGMEIWTNMTFDTTTWEWEGGIGQLESQAFDLAYDDATDRIYGCFFDPDPEYKGQRLVFGWMDPAAYSTDYAFVNPVCDLFECFSGLSFDGEGNLFALTKEGLLYQVDKNTGDRELIGSTGLTPYFNSSATIDPATGLMYYFLCTEASTVLYSIDTATAEATAIYTLPGGEEVQGLAMFVPLADGDAPSSAVNVGLDFVGGDLTGTVSFDVPAVSYGGSTLSGEADYEIGYRPYGEEGDFMQLATGKASYGNRAECGITLPANGQYQIAVTLSNASGEAPAALADKYIGYDTPVSPQNVTLTADGNVLSLSWTPAETSMHNGYVDRANLKYNVVRMPDEAEVAHGISETSFEETLTGVAGRVHYYYTVTTDNHGMVSSPGTSNTVGVGAYAAPYECGFETKAEFDEYTVITKAESPDNYYYWQYHMGMKAAHVGNGRYADDDILVTPAIHLEEGKTYNIELMLSNSSNDPAVIALRAGSAPTREALEEHELIAPTEFAAKKPSTTVLSTQFTAPSTAPWHFGVHSLTPASMWDDTYLHSFTLNAVNVDAVESVANQLAIRISKGMVELTAAEGTPYCIAMPNGIVVAVGKSTGDDSFALAPGLYILKAGYKTYKVRIP